VTQSQLKKKGKSHDSAPSFQENGDWVRRKKKRVSCLSRGRERGGGETRPWKKKIKGEKSG